MAANLEDVLLQTGGGWAFSCEIFNTVIYSAVNKVPANPFYKLQKIKRKLNDTGLYFESGSHYWKKLPSKLDAAVRIEPGWFL
jgi:hypothetical protein